jgi:hypothetical protein
MEVAIEEKSWKMFAQMSTKEMAQWLVQTVKEVKWSKYQKTKRGPKKPVKKIQVPGSPHLSTHVLLAQRKVREKSC